MIRLGAAEAARTRSLLFGLFLALGPARFAFGLATEHFGNAPVQWNFPAEVLAQLNRESRVYWCEVNGDPHFFFRGNTRALNDALSSFAAGKGDGRELILLPGAGERKSLDGSQRIAYDWEIHIPDGFYGQAAKRETGTQVMTRHPTMIVHVNVPPPSRPVDAGQLARWIAELDKNAFATREQASAELAKLGDAAGPALEKALSKSPSAEARRRLEALVERLQGINLDLLNVPAGIRVRDATDLLERNLRGLKSSNPTIRGLACGNLGKLTRYTEQALPALLKMLQSEKHEYVRRSVSGALGRLGKSAAPALPTLRAGLADADKNVRGSFQSAIESIESDSSESDRDKSIRIEAIQKRIAELRKTRASKTN